MQREQLRMVAAASAFLILAGQPVISEANNWGGFYVDAGLGARSTTIELDEVYERSSQSESLFFRSWDSMSNAFDRDVGQTNLLGQFSGGWRWDNGKVVVGLGLFADVGGDDAGSERVVNQLTVNYESTYPFYPYSYTETIASGSRIDLTQKSRWGISVDIGPSWRTQPYAKLAYAWSDIEYEETASCALGMSSPTRFSFSETYSGLAVGGGVRHLYDDNLYFFAEVMWQDLGSQSRTGIRPCSRPNQLYPAETEQSRYRVEVSPENLTGVVGFGWKF